MALTAATRVAYLRGVKMGAYMEQRSTVGLCMANRATVWVQSFESKYRANPASVEKPKLRWRPNLGSMARVDRRNSQQIQQPRLRQARNDNLATQIYPLPTPIQNDAIGRGDDVFGFGQYFVGIKRQFH